MMAFPKFPRVPKLPHYVQACAGRRTKRHDAKRYRRSKRWHVRCWPSEGAFFERGRVAHTPAAEVSAYNARPGTRCTRGTRLFISTEP